MGSCINIICTNFGYESYYGSIIALLVITFGLISSVIYSLTLISHRKQYMIQSVYIFFGILTLALAELSIVNHKIILFSIFASILGICGFPILSMVFEKSTRSFPNVPLVIINSILNTSGQLFAAIIQM